MKEKGDWRVWVTWGFMFALVVLVTGFRATQGWEIANGDYNDSQCGTSPHNESLDPCMEVCQDGPAWFWFGNRAWCHRELKPRP